MKLENIFSFSIISDTELVSYSIAVSSPWGIWHLTHLPLDKMATISKTIFSDAFLWMKSFVFWLKMSLKSLQKDPINNIPALVQIMTWRWIATSHYLKQCWPDPLMHICGTRGRWVKKYVFMLMKIPGSNRVHWHHYHVNILGHNSQGDFFKLYFHFLILLPITPIFLHKPGPV